MSYNLNNFVESLTDSWEISQRCMYKKKDFIVSCHRCAKSPEGAEMAPNFRLNKKVCWVVVAVVNGFFLQSFMIPQFVAKGWQKNPQNWEDRRHSCDDDSSLYGFDMAVKQTVSTHVSSLSVDVININRSTESRCAANFYMGTLFVFSDSWSYLLEENTWLTIDQGIDTYSPI